MQKVQSPILIACLLLASSSLPAQVALTPASIQWIASTQSAPWTQMQVEPAPSSAQIAAQPSPAPSSTQTAAILAIQLDARTTYQTIDGFGSCFNDLGWQALQALDPPAREQALRSLFAPTGANFTLGRAPIGANDFATGWYSYDETPNDFALTRFSIDHDRQTLLPFIHAAMRYQPSLGIWAVPWSPPTWMKTNGAYKGGEMKDDPQILASYALYFSKYIQAYRAEGINLFAVMPQNEPRYNNNVYPQAAWSGALMNVFLRDYLVPRLQQDKLSIQLWQGTIVNENIADYILPVLDDPRTAPSIAGVAYQYGGQQALAATHQRYPDKKLMQSETECYNGDNLWQQGLITFRKIIDDTNNFAGSYFFWNTVLDDRETSSWGWRQNSLLTVDRSAKQVRYNPEFYSLKHFSASVLPGARRITVTGGPFPQIVAFANPSGSQVVEFENDSTQPVDATLQSASKLYRLHVPAKSMNTVTLSAQGQAQPRTTRSTDHLAWPPAITDTQPFTRAIRNPGPTIRQWRVAMLSQIPAMKPAVKPDAKRAANPAMNHAAEPDPPRVVLVASDSITIRGARTHNLKSIDVDIPHNALTVVSGVSGSGKSSLAFDTIYAEGQRRYVESLSAYARQFLERIEKPDVDFMDGLAPAIAIKQKNQTRNPRSTVATATEIYDYLRLLYARCGTVTCLHCGGVVRHDTVDEIVSALLALPEGTRAYALFPITRAEIKFEPLQPSTVEAVSDPPKPAKKISAKKSTKSISSVAGLSSLTDALKDRLAELRRRGYNRLYQQIDGQPGKIVEFSTPESLLSLDFAQPIFVLIDRLSLAPDSRARIVDAIETGYRESGEVQFHIVPREESEASQHLRYSAAFECSTCHRAYREPEPRLFSFNNPYGACPRCQGFGNTIDFDPNLILPDHSRTLAQGAIAPWTTHKYRPFHGEMIRFAKSVSIPTDVPYYDLDPPQQDLLWNGPGSGPYPGIRGFFAALERKKYKLHVRVFLSKYRGYALCPDCNGQRLRAEARAVLIAPQNGPAKNICEVSTLTITAAQAFFDNLQLTPAQSEIAGKVLEEVRQRIHFLMEVGLEYLTLDRLSSTLSGGESQRIQLATSLGSRLVGALYVLDEPSIGLHPRDTAKLIRILHSLRDLGNTILVVEHDPSVIRSADHLLDLGPGAGELGGHVLAAGTVAQVTANPQSITGKYLSGRLNIPIPRHRREPGRELLQLTGVRLHNLRGIDVNIPLNLLCCITGVSGSGKSTLIHQVLYRALQQSLHREPDASAPEPSAFFRSLTGTQHLNDVVLVDQSPIGRTPRSNPVTYIKAFDDIRALFAAQPDAKRRGFGPGAFSFNVPGGRCDTCEGDGTVTVEMQFLADIELPCEECNGTRYKSSILEIKYKGRNIHDVLNMTVKQALSLFAGIPRIVDKLAVLDEVGLGYVRLGQSATTLSGGEAQRVKLASHLAIARANAIRVGNSSDLFHPSDNPTAAQIAARSRSRTLYILDEPTTGLHFDDVQKLLAAFRKLIDGGGSLLVIEHNLDIIKSADWVIDLGPEGGDAGGQVVATGTPEAIAAHPRSHTGTHLRPLLGITL